MWKKRLAAALTAGMMALSLCSCSLKTHDMIEEKRTVPVPPKLVFLGDSIAAGYGLEGYDKKDLYQCESYANIIGKDYTELLAEECGHTMINDSVSGDTSQDLLDLLGYYLSRLPILIAAILIGALISGLYTSLFIPDKYTATSKMYMVSACPVTESTTILSRQPNTTSLTDIISTWLRSTSAKLPRALCAHVPIAVNAMDKRSIFLGFIII